MYIYNDGMGDAIVMLYRKVGEANWLSMGAGDGQVWWGDFSQEVKAMGGFRNWLAKIVGLIKAKLEAWCKSIYPDAPVGDPATFAEFQAWASSHTTWQDFPKSTTATMG